MENYGELWRITENYGELCALVKHSRRIDSFKEEFSKDSRRISRAPFDWGIWGWYESHVCHVCHVSWQNLANCVNIFGKSSGRPRSTQAGQVDLSNPSHRSSSSLIITPLLGVVTTHLLVARSVLLEVNPQQISYDLHRTVWYVLICLMLLLIGYVDICWWSDSCSYARYGACLRMCLYRAWQLCQARKTSCTSFQVQIVGGQWWHPCHNVPQLCAKFRQKQYDINWHYHDCHAGFVLQIWCAHLWTWQR